MATQSPTNPEEVLAEFARLGVIAGGDLVIDPQVGRSVHRSAYPKALEEAADVIVSQLDGMWDAVHSLLSRISPPGFCSISASRMAVSALESLHGLASRSPLADNPVREAISTFMSSVDVASVPSPAAAELSALLSNISYHEYMVGRLSYKSQLIGMLQPVKAASVMDGPYGRLDLPMGDRVIPWRDIEESIEGDSVAKKSQFRYKGWQDGYNEPRFRQGFYWRELAQSPYLIDEAKNESPYRYREYLWRHLG